METYNPKDSFELIGIRILMKYISNLRRDLVSEDQKDIEYAHRIRVSSRRLREALNIFKTCISENILNLFKKEVKKITKSLGKARDLDIQIEFVKELLETKISLEQTIGVERLLLRLTQERLLEQKNVLENVNKLLEKKVLEKFEKHLKKRIKKMQKKKQTTNTSKQKDYFSSKINEMIKNYITDITTYRKRIQGSDKKEELHELRIKVKHFRYALEIFSEICSNRFKSFIEPLKNLQTLLGDIHDCDVWEEFLPEFLKKEKEKTIDYFGNSKFFTKIKPGISYMQKLIPIKKAKLYKEFIIFWNKLEDGGFFNKLLNESSNIEVQNFTPTT